MSKLIVTATLMGCLLCTYGPAQAADADLFRGKNVTLMVNYELGGPTDVEARVIGRHLSKHIPGNPNIIVRKMGGAGGMIGNNWLGQVAQPDGLTIAYLTGLVAGAVQQSPALKIDPSTIPFIASVETTIVYYARADLLGGIKEPKDILGKKGVFIGGLRPDSQKDLTLRAQLDLLGIPYRYVPGYRGGNDLRLALERNEIQMTSEGLSAYRASIEPNLVKTGVAIPLWYDTAEPYRKSGDPDAKGIAAGPFQQLYQSAKGAPPNSDLWNMMTVMSDVGTRFLRTIYVPPKTDAHRVEIYRSAIAALAKDGAYLADADKALMFRPRFSVGPDANAAFAEIVKPNAKLGEFIRNYVVQGTAQEKNQPQ